MEENIMADVTNVAKKYEKNDRCDGGTHRVAKAPRAPVTCLCSLLRTAHRCPPRPSSCAPRRARHRRELHARGRSRRPRRQPPRAADRHSAAPNCRSPPSVREERVAAAKRGDRWGGWGEQAIARRRARGGQGWVETGCEEGSGGEYGSRARACAPRPWSLDAAEEVNIVQYDWPASWRRVFRFFVLAHFLREEEEEEERLAFFSSFSSLLDLSRELSSSSFASRILPDNWTKIRILRKSLIVGVVSRTLFRMSPKRKTITNAQILDYTRM